MSASSSIAPDSSTDDSDADASSLSLTSHVGSLGMELEHDAHETVHEFEGFFTHYMGHMLLFLAALLLSLAAGYIVWRVCRALLTAYGLAESRRVQLGMVVCAGVVYLGMSAGFAVLGALRCAALRAARAPISPAGARKRTRATGLNFTSIVFALSVVSIGFSAAVSTWLANVGGAFNLRSKVDVRLGRRVTTYYAGNEFSGTLVAMHVGFCEMEMAPEPGTGHARRLYMPNRIMDDGPLIAIIPPPLGAAQQPPPSHLAAAAAMSQQSMRLARAAAAPASSRQDAWMSAAAGNEHGQYGGAPSPPVQQYLHQGPVLRELFPGANHQQHVAAAAAAAAAASSGSNGFAMGGALEKQLTLDDFNSGWGSDVDAADLAAAFMPVSQ